MTIEKKPERRMAGTLCVHPECFEPRLKYCAAHLPTMATTPESSQPPDQRVTPVDRPTTPFTEED